MGLETGDHFKYGCWAYARRYFYRALETALKRTEPAHVLCQLLYTIECTLRERDAGVFEGYVNGTLFRFLRTCGDGWNRIQGYRTSPGGRAVCYTLARWKKLCRYTQDGSIEIDNNGMKTVIRPLALGRKNYMFAGGEVGEMR